MSPSAKTETLADICSAQLGELQQALAPLKLRPMLLICISEDAKDVKVFSADNFGDKETVILLEAALKGMRKKIRVM